MAVNVLRIFHSIQLEWIQKNTSNIYIYIYIYMYVYICIDRHTAEFFNLTNPFVCLFVCKCSAIR